MTFWEMLKSVYITPPVADESFWHKCASAPMFAKVAGERSPLGQMWRRKVNGKWEYRQDPPTADDAADVSWP